MFNLRGIAFILSTGCIVIVSRCAPAQEHVGPKPQNIEDINKTHMFQVATIKPVLQGARGVVGFISYPGGKVYVGKSTLRTLLSYAFNIPEFGIVGGPEWINSDRYDVTLLPTDDSRSLPGEQPGLKATPSDNQREMLKTLLMERCDLKIHEEIKEQPAYLLTKNGKALHLTEAKDKTNDPRGNIAASGEAFGTNISMQFFASQLSRYFGRFVIDQTQLKGTYDYQLEPDDASNGGDREAAALEVVHRLGLKLKAGNFPTRAIVIDAVARPTAD